MHNRVKFPPGKQREFIELAQDCLGFDAGEMAKLVGVHPRSFRDWRREKLTMSLSALRIFCKQARISQPDNIEVLQQYWYTKIGANKSWETILKKYGKIPVDEEKRKRGWRDWWIKKGQFQNRYFSPKSIKTPKKTRKLSEFVGITLGDGGISERQVTIYLNCFTDALYANYVKLLIENLFGVRPACYLDQDNSIFKITVSRTRLVNFCRSIGLPLGNKIKNKLDIPDWIKNNQRF